MYTIHAVNDSSGTVGWAVVFDKVELVAQFKYIEDATFFADSKETEYVEAKQALLNAYANNMV
jgi:hypothetical protein